jgi:hypothetical protein
LSESQRTCYHENEPPERCEIEGCGLNYLCQPVSLVFLGGAFFFLSSGSVLAFRVAVPLEASRSYTLEEEPVDLADPCRSRVMLELDGVFGVLGVLSPSVLDELDAIACRE